MSEGPSRSTQITVQSGLLVEKIDALLKDIETLEERLSPVISNAPETNKELSAKEALKLVPLAEFLAVQADKVSTASRRLSSIRGRIEL